MLPRLQDDAYEHPLWFIRHGATQANLDGLRCGGDLDLPMTAIGREQILLAAQHLSALDLGIQTIVCAGLLRTRESAAIISRVLGGLPVAQHDGFKERLLGAWNLHPSEADEPAIQAGVTPPGGESREAFAQRVRQAMAGLIAAQGRKRVLLVGSRGVARVLREIVSGHAPGHVSGAGARNGEIMVLDLAQAFAPAIEATRIDS